MNRSNAGTRVMDRIAIAAVLAAAILILTMVELTARSAPLPMPATAVVAMATHHELQTIALNLCKPSNACTPGRK